MKTAEWLKQNYSEFLIHCKNTHRRIEFFEEMLNKFAQERTKDMYPKEFVEWMLEKNISHNLRDRRYLSSYALLQLKDFIGECTLDELFIYWRDKIKQA